MTDFGSNLLKLSDFPFTWTLVGLLSVLGGNNFDFEDFNINYFLPYLLVVGVIGTTLSITDPLGSIIRFLSKKLLFDLELINQNERVFDSFKELINKAIEDSEKFTTYFYGIFENQNNKKFKSLSEFNSYIRQHLSDEPTKSEHIINTIHNFLTYKIDVNKADIKPVRFIDKIILNATAKTVQEIIDTNIFDYLKDRCISTNTITKEIDKIVSLLYFEILAGFFMILVFTSNFQSLETNIQQLKCVDNIYCNFFKLNYHVLLLGLSLLAFIGIAIVIFQTFKKMKNKINIIINFFLSVDVLPAMLDNNFKLFDKIRTTDMKTQSRYSHNDLIRYITTLSEEQNQTILNDIKTKLNDRYSEYSKFIEQNDWGISAMYADLVNKNNLEYSNFLAKQVTGFLFVVEKIRP